MTLPRLKSFALSALMLGIAGTAPAALRAQEASNARGIQMRFDVGLGLETQSNRALDPADPGSSSSASVDLGVGLLTETRTQRLSFDLRGTLRGVTGETDTNDGLNPTAQLRYDRSSAAARLSLSASLRETDLTSGGFAFDEETLQFVVVEGTATRRTASAAARLNWRDDAPLGFGVSAEVSDNSYRGGVATGLGGTPLTDTQRLTLGASARLDINEVTSLGTGLTYSTFDEDGVADSRETWTLSNTLTLDRPLGGLTFNLTLTDTEEGNRVAASIGRNLQYPLGSVSGSLGVTRSAIGDTLVNGGLSLTRALPQGNLTFGLTRGVTSGTLEDSEQISTSLRAGYVHELSALASLNFNADWAEAEQTATGLTTTNASIGASYNRALTEDWNMNVGIRHRFRDDDTTGSASSNELFLNLGRSYLTRF